LRALLGLVPRRGSVRFAGDETAREATHRIVRRGIGYVPEDRDVFAGLTVEENLKLSLRNGSPANGSGRYGLVYDLFPELKERARQRAGTLSGGQQQMVAIARALLNRNRLLLIDEPTKGLAPALVADVARLLERIAETETALLVEQNLAVVRRLARSIVVLDQGRVVHTGSAADLDDEALVHGLLGAGYAA
jgi:branched-chain amino acid transport system ATP-binding protein